MSTHVYREGLHPSLTYYALTGLCAAGLKGRNTTASGVARRLIKT
jgi:hypothetical protein